VGFESLGFVEVNANYGGIVQGVEGEGMSGRRRGLAGTDVVDGEVLSTQTVFVEFYEESVAVDGDLGNGEERDVVVVVVGVVQRGIVVKVEANDEVGRAVKTTTVTAEGMDGGMACTETFLSNDVPMTTEYCVVPGVVE
jgi:hypothetical protein